MVRRSGEEMASLEAERLIGEQKIQSLPVNPTEIAESLGILVKEKEARDGVSGMLIRMGNEFGIAYATHIDSEGFRRFSIAHEIGHYRIPGHMDAVLAHGDIHESHAGFVEGNQYEREADVFAASLLMPSALFVKEMRSVGDGMQAVLTLAERCITSLPAAAIRYVEKAKVPIAMIVSTGPRINYCFMSGPLKDFRRLDWPRKGHPLPEGSETEEFNSELQNVRARRQAEAEVDLRLWFGGEREVPGREEILGLGRYEKTLTMLTSDVFADEEDEQQELEESWTPVFRR